MFDNVTYSYSVEERRGISEMGSGKKQQHRVGRRGEERNRKKYLSESGRPEGE